MIVSVGAPIGDDRLGVVMGGDARGATASIMFFLRRYLPAEIVLLSDVAENEKFGFENELPPAG
jgi:hypothetical protein